MAARRDILAYGQNQLKLSGIRDWKTDGWLLYEHASGENRETYFLKSMEELPAGIEAAYMDFIKQRCSHIPVQYITGEQMFMGFCFRVDESVLVPRMDTEVLVLTVEKYVKENLRILDLCTGSGCIAISLKKRNPGLIVSAADVSTEALRVAKKNARFLQADISIYQSDLLECFTDGENKKFDIIVSNPPYIPTYAIEGLEPEVCDHEPRLALDGMADGLEFYRRIVRDSRDFLSRNGILFFEIGQEQANAVSEIMKTGGFGNISVVKDLAGFDRVVYGGI